MKATDIQTLAHELKFWSEFVKSERFLLGWMSKKRTPEFREDVHDFIKSVNHDNILDVGSGVLSLLYGSFRGKNLIACDPLGPLYECIFDYLGNGLVPCIPFSGEELPYKETFDVVHCSNAIDHAEWPNDVFENMFKACKKGGYVIIQGFENEADHEKGKGFHQYNLTLLNHWLRFQHIKHEEAVHFDTDSTGIPYEVVRAEVIPLPQKKNWIIWIAKKL